MDTLTQALRGAAQTAAPALQRLPSVLIVGAGGTLGSAVLAEALVLGRFQRVAAVVTTRLTSSLRGLRPLTLHQLQQGGGAGADLAFIVFERERHSNGRDLAFHAPEPDALPALAHLLRAAGVRQLLVVVPHAPALLPQALKRGFASLDEGAVAALGFEHLVFIRAAQAASPSARGHRLQRFAAWWLSQLSWMVPASEQPLRAVMLAQRAVQLAALLPAAAPGTRVLPPEVLQQAANADDAGAVLQAWLATGRPG